MSAPTAEPARDRRVAEVTSGAVLHLVHVAAQNMDGEKPEKRSLEAKAEKAAKKQRKAEKAAKKAAKLAKAARLTTQ